MIEVKLTWPEIMMAHYVASQRQVQNIMTGAKHKYGFEGDGEQTHARGCIGELAVAKVFNRFWSGSVGNRKVADVGVKLEVRTVDTPYKCLMMHDDDKDDSPYILADATDLPFVRLVGWKLGRDCKQKHYWEEKANNKRPAYFVPREDLEPMERLKVLA
jgi:hypothetical protein